MANEERPKFELVIRSGGRDLRVLVLGDGEGEWDIFDRDVADVFLEEIQDFVWREKNRGKMLPPPPG